MYSSIVGDVLILSDLEDSINECDVVPDALIFVGCKLAVVTLLKSTLLLGSKAGDCVLVVLLFCKNMFELKYPPVEELTVEKENLGFDLLLLRILCKDCSALLYAFVSCLFLKTELFKPVE